MNKEFIPYEQELELKDLGYISEPIIDSWRSLTLYQQSFRWFREKHSLHSEIRTYTVNFFTFIIQERKGFVKYIEYGGINKKFDTYEEAELACLKQLIEIVKNK